jgi:hypothetical protein
MTEQIKFNMKYYFDVRNYLDSSESFHTPKPSVGEDARIYISSQKNKDRVISGLKLGIANNEGVIKPLNGHPIPSNIIYDLEKITRGEELK